MTYNNRERKRLGMPLLKELQLMEPGEGKPTVTTVDLRGVRSGRLVGVMPHSKSEMLNTYFQPPRKETVVLWMLQCDCGNMVRAVTVDFTHKKLTSCSLCASCGIGENNRTYRFEEEIDAK